MCIRDSPATPPGMRIRTGRFDGLRLAGKRCDSQPVEESVRQRPVERHRRVAPPAAAVTGNLPGRVRGYSASDQLAVDDPTSLPVLELHGPQPMADPTVDVGKRARCLREPEVSLPTREVGSERLAHLREAASGTAPCQFAHTLLQAFDGLGCYAPTDHSSLG